jgi:hypothetical protein
MKKSLLIVLVVFAHQLCSAQNANEQIELIPKRFFKNEAYKKCGIEMTPTQLIQVFKDDPKMTQFVKPLALNYAGETILKAVGGILIFWPLTESIYRDNPNWNLAYIGAACYLVAIPFQNGFTKRAKSAIDYYNNGYKQASRVSFHLQVDSKGLGVAMKF